MDGKEGGLEMKSEPSSCCGASATPRAADGAIDPGKTILAGMPCCGGPPPAAPMERPGYELCPFVEELIPTPAGPVPRVRTTLDRSDIRATIRVRIGFGRDRYRIAPGLYCVGRPGPDAPVLVTANYKLTFDALRRELPDLEAWILVLETLGVNVWCAAGKGTFSTDEVIRRVKASGLEAVVRHRKLILPQLSATGVSARQVRKGCGFEVVWGPVRAADLKPFLDAGMKADAGMRRVTFDLWERLVLIPVEIWLIRKPMLWTLAILLVLSAMGPQLGSPGQVGYRWMIAASAAAVGLLAGGVLTPALLPWIPGRAFAVKGTLVGVVFGAVTLLWTGNGVGTLGALGLLLLAVAVSSYLAMNFTGSTPFTSPSGVEREMRVAIPFQLAAALLAAVLWVGGGFVA